MNQSASLKRTSFTRKMPDNAIKPSPGKRKKKCANRDCRELFVPSSPFICHCSPECGLIIAQDRLAKQKLKKAKAERSADKLKLETFKSIPELKAEAQVIFNKFIRARDANLSCICCDKWNKSNALTGGEWDAGHYRSRGSADHLRFNEMNVHKQLKNCNRYASGNAVEYRLGLIKRIGLPFVEALEADQTIIKWTREILNEIKIKYREKIKSLKNT